jgi:Salmonella virulence plasmid 65kDa B protein
MQFMHRTCYSAGVTFIFVKKFRFGHGSVQSKTFSMLMIAPTLLAFLFPISVFATDYAPSVPNPNVFSADLEQPKVDDPTGAFTQRLQLDIPPGRNGLQPDVSLNYNSQNTTDSIVGYGWSLSIPYIERLNKTLQYHRSHQACRYVQASYTLVRNQVIHPH